MYKKDYIDQIFGTAISQRAIMDKSNALTGSKSSANIIYKADYNFTNIKNKVNMTTNLNNKSMCHN